MTWNNVGIFVAGFACGAGAAVGTIALMNYIQDKKEQSGNDGESQESYEEEFARVMGVEGYDGNNVFVGVNEKSWNVDDDSSVTYPYTSSAKEDSLKDLKDKATDAVDYKSYFDSSLANDISESMANPLINPSSLLEDERAPEAGEDEEPTREESLTGQFLKDPASFNIPKNATWLSYFGMDDTLCEDDNMQKAMKLERVFNIPICAAIRNAADLGDEGQDRFIVIDAKKAKIFVVDVLPNEAWSDAIAVE